MATLTAAELSDVRRQFVSELVDGCPPILRATLNAAIQAVEDVLVSASLQTAISNAINAATSPVTLNAVEKRLLVKYVLWSRYFRGNV